MASKEMMDTIRALFEMGGGKQTSIPDEQIIEMVADAAENNQRALRVCIQFDFSAREWMVVEYSRDGWSVLHRCTTNIDAQHWRAQYLRNPS